MLALDLSRPPLPPLLLGLNAQRLRLGSQDGGPALEYPLVDVRRALHGVVTATKDARTVQAQDVARHNAGHAEGQSDLVAFLYKVGEAVDVDGDVVRRLGDEEGEKVLDRVGDRGRRGVGMTLLEGKRSDLAIGRVGRVVDMLLGDGLDDGRGRVETTGENWGREPR